MTKPRRGFCGDCSCLISAPPRFCAPIGRKKKTTINSKDAMFFILTPFLPQITRIYYLIRIADYITLKDFARAGRRKGAKEKTKFKQIFSFSFSVLFVCPRGKIFLKSNNY